MKPIQFFPAILIFSLLTTLSNGCIRETSPVSPASSGIYGTWQWVKSTGGIAGTEQTPGTTGYTVVLVFTADGTYKYYRNTTLIETAHFTIRREQVTGYPNMIDVIHYEHEESHISQAISFNGKDTLNLGDLCIDCFGHQYIRVQ